MYQVKPDFWKLLLYTTLYWLFIANFLVVIRFYGNPDLKVFNFGERFMQANLSSFAMGLFFTIMETFVVNRIKRSSFINLLLLKSFIYILFFVVLMFMNYANGNGFLFALNLLATSETFVIILFLSFATVLYHFTKQMSNRFGPQIFLKYITGHYFKPKEEQRLFMFLDLRNSTQIAEELQHVVYSEFIQECFVLLSEPIRKYNAQVYQFVGDEVVLTWEENKAYKNNNYINFYKSYTKILDEKSDYFLAKYGFCPTFKAGTDSGSVTAAEVGTIKTEIAYHGDVLNTASRIQGLCNTHQAYFLISEHVKNKSHLSPNGLTDLGYLTLRGKKKDVKVFAVEV
ncbi:MAG: adenylate/guanylate cyclase domain-containing protein [Flavobacteriales bacterium]